MRGVCVRPAAHARTFQSLNGEVEEYYRQTRDHRDAIEDLGEEFYLVWRLFERRYRLVQGRNVFRPVLEVEA